MSPNPLLLQIAILILFLTHPSLCVHDELDEFVMDIDGNKLEVGESYVVEKSWSDYMGVGGGLDRFPISSGGICPRFVGPILAPSNKGLPIRFIPFNTTFRNIPISSFLNVQFSAPDFCRTKGVWKLSFDAHLRGERIGTDGDIITSMGDGGESTTNGFKIVKHNEKWEDGSIAYKFIYVYSQGFSSDVGIIVDFFGQLWLGLISDRPLLVSFKKADQNNNNNKKKNDNVQLRTTL